MHSYLFSFTLLTLKKKRKLTRKIVTITLLNTTKKGEKMFEMLIIKWKNED